MTYSKTPMRDLKKNQPPPMNILETPTGGVNHWLARGRLQGQLWLVDLVEKAVPQGWKG